MAHARYAIDEFMLSQRDDLLLIVDIGPWENHPTITNDAEYVVKELVLAGRLTKDRRLFYRDSHGQVDEVLVANGVFSGFAPGPRSL